VHIPYLLELTSQGQACTRLDFQQVLAVHKDY
jgi:hypothetical protein